MYNPILGIIGIIISGIIPMVLFWIVKKIFELYEQRNGKSS
jgi:hypothetical protein